MKVSTPQAKSDGSAEARIGMLVEERYRLSALLGEGGLCAVYRAEDLQRARTVAVKILPGGLATRADLAARFQREATTGKRIEHPNVVAVFDSGALADGSLFLVMELVEGRSLADVLEEGRLPVARAVAIARQILLGLDGAHRLSIAHRDIKPDNVMLVTAGGQETVKLVDFGIASNDRAAVKLTAAGVVFGTPEYISPEMAMGLAVDARADLYSCGVVLFEMVTGRLPFTGDMKALLSAHVTQTPPLARGVAPDANIPPALENVILRSLAKLPEKRFPSAAAMVEALDAATGDRPRRRRRGLWVALAIVLLLLAAAAGVGWWWSGEQATMKDSGSIGLRHLRPQAGHPSRRPVPPGRATGRRRHGSGL